MEPFDALSKINDNHPKGETYTMEVGKMFCDIEKKFFLAFMILGMPLLLSLACGPADKENGSNDGGTDAGSDAASDSGTDGGDGGQDGFWVHIPGGSFQMGCSPADNACQDDEKPAHAVNLPSFYMTRTEITQQKYQEVIGTNPSLFPNCPECPVENVTWDDAKAFCEALGGRLPTEAEWEFAARGGTTTAYYCGDDPACLDNVAWYDPNGEMKTHPVAQKQPNAYGLFDMLGNDEEWVQDWYAKDYYGSSPGDDPQGPSTGDTRMVRGGAWGYPADALRASYRSGGGGPQTTTSNYTGIRCARD